jgi:hypothetical protein
LRRLVVVDHLDDRWLRQAIAVTAAGDEWDILLLGVDGLRFRQQHAAMCARLGTCRVLDLTTQAAAAHAQVRDFLVPLVHRLPSLPCVDGRSLGDLLRAGHHHWWWFLETSEKSPMRGPLVDQLYAVALVRTMASAAPYDQLWLALADRPLAGALARASWPPHVRRAKAPPSATPAGGGRVRYWRTALCLAGRTLASRAILRLAGLSRAPDPASFLFYSVFPSWWLAPWGANAADRFFPNLPATHAGAPVHYAVWVDTQPRELWRRRRQLRAAMTRHRLIPLQPFVGLRALAGLLSAAAYRKTRQFLGAARACLSVRFMDLDVSDLVLHDLARATTGVEFFRDRLLASAVGALTARHTIRALVFRSECQPLERALIYGTRGRTRAVGLWHGVVALQRHYLPFHFVSGEFTPDTGGLDGRLPVPDAMLASGPLCADVLRSRGYPPERIAVCGPVRHRHLIAYLATRPSQPVARARVRLPARAVVLFVATSVVRAASEALLGALPGVVDGLGEVRIVLKVHPARPLDPTLVRRTLAALGGAAQVCPPTADMYDYIAASDAVLLPGSTLAFEAMALGVMPIAYESPHAFNAASLADFDDACFVERTVSGLRRALDDTLTHSQRAQARRHRWPAVLRGVFRDLDGDPTPSLFAALASLGIAGEADTRALTRPAEPCQRSA